MFHLPKFIAAIIVLALTGATAAAAEYNFSVSGSYYCYVRSSSSTDCKGDGTIPLLAGTITGNMVFDTTATPACATPPGGFTSAHLFTTNVGTYTPETDLGTFVISPYICPGQAFLENTTGTVAMSFIFSNYSTLYSNKVTQLSGDPPGYIFDIGGYSGGIGGLGPPYGGGTKIVGTLTPTSAEVTGNIKVAGATTTGFTGHTCGDIVVDVSSKEQTSPPPGWTTVWFATPKWQRQANATGSWGSGSCSYQVVVPANSEFDVYLLPSIREVPCGGYDTVTSTPAQAGWFKVNAGDQKTQDFTLDSVGCIHLE